jgi:hypothetical protein
MTILRVALIALGLPLAVFGLYLELSSSGSGAAEGGPTVVEIALRPSGTVASTGGTPVWHLVPEGEPRAAEDVVFSIGFDIHKVRRRKAPDTTELRAEVLTEPGEVLLPGHRNRGIALANIGLIADEVEHRTGKPIYARAVRNLGESVSAAGGRAWWGWGLFIVGGMIAGAGISPRRFGWRG